MNTETEAAKKALELPPDMNERYLVANVRFQKHAIQAYGQDPPPIDYSIPCCSLCCRMPVNPDSSLLCCSTCQATWCSKECYITAQDNLHTPQHCEFRSNLLKGNCEGISAYISSFEYCLPARPAPAPHYDHQVPIRFSPIYFPNMGWLRGVDKKRIMDALYSVDQF
jgi:hypothetical protein